MGIVQNVLLVAIVMEEIGEINFSDMMMNNPKTMTQNIYVTETLRRASWTKSKNLNEK